MFGSLSPFTSDKTKVSFPKKTSMALLIMQRSVTNNTEIEGTGLGRYLEVIISSKIVTYDRIILSWKRKINYGLKQSGLGGVGHHAHGKDG